MSWLFAPFYDRFVAPAEEASFGAWRRELLAPLSGTVVEIGAGTGVNLTHHPDTVERLIAIEPDPGMRKQLVAKLDSSRRDGTLGPGSVEVMDATAEAIPLGDGEADAVVAMLVLCTVPDPDAALAEARRVLAPGGRLVFLEHVAAEQRPDRLRWQRRIDPIWKRVAGGCRLTRRTGAAIEAAGFRIEDLTSESARKTSPLLRATIRGVAVPA